MAEDLGWSVGAFIREQLERACERGRSGGSVRDVEESMSAPLILA